MHTYNLYVITLVHIGPPMGPELQTGHLERSGCTTSGAQAPRAPQDVPVEAGSAEMHYYDELGRQDEGVVLTLTMDADAVEACAGRDPNDDAEAAAAWKENSVPPLELVLRTRWPAARVDWNGTDPIL